MSLTSPWTSTTRLKGGENEKAMWSILGWGGGWRLRSGEIRMTEIRNVEKSVQDLLGSIDSDVGQIQFQKKIQHLFQLVSTHLWKKKAVSILCSIMIRTTSEASQCLINSTNIILLYLKGKH